MARKVLVVGWDAADWKVINAPAPLVDKGAVPDDPAQYVTVVAGLPRSDTSMMMQMLAAGSLPVLTDGQREADGDNPRGTFELDAATRPRQDRDEVREAKGKAVKIVAQLLPFLPPDLPHRVVFTDRNLSEILASKRVVLENLGRTQARATGEQIEQAFRGQLKQVRICLARQPNIKTLLVSHHEAITDPRAVAERVDAFIGGGLDVQAMAATVDGSLYRQRALGAARSATAE